jgi:transposase
MEKTLRSLSPKSETAEAIRYALSRWRALTRYVDDGQIEIGRVEMWRGGLDLA